MCGIVGYIGDKASVPILINGLKSLEYRGYDSAGLAILNDGDVKVIKRQGYLKELEDAVSGKKLESTTGIGHTRWATHGKPSEANAHPHTACNENIVLVHNGIIENFSQLKDELEKKGHKFSSETDTEVISHLVEEKYSGDLKSAVEKAIKELEGSFALVVLSKDHPNSLIAARKNSPLVVGLGEGENFIASDIPAILDYTRDVIILEDGEIAEVNRDGIEIETFDGSPVERDSFEVTWDIEAAEKGGYEDFMLKEIYEQPQGVEETLRGRLSPKGEIVLDEIELTKSQVQGLNKVFIIACGTSYHAGLVAKETFEVWARLPSEIEISSEFRYREPVIDDKSLVVAITQSGETADTLAGVKEAKKRGARVIAITNAVGSSVTREADGVIYTHAGPEIGVAATKTLTSQMSALYVLALYLAQVRKKISVQDIQKIAKELQGLPAKVEQVLKIDGEVKECAKKYIKSQNILFLGRGPGLPVALEGALKLKEISYIHSEGYPAGEMKHGPIALIADGTPVVVVATEGHTYEKMVGNIEEVKARGAEVIAVATEGDKLIEKYVDHVFYVPKTSEYLSSIVAVIPLQFLAYHIAKIKGCNVDQPRNLAKSVTVE